MPRIKLFDDRAFYKQLFAIASPIMAQNLVNALVNLLDTTMIGQLGTTAIAGVGLGNQIFFFYMILTFGIVSGGSVFVAQYWGKGDVHGIRHTTGLCLFLALVPALLFTAFCALWPEELIGIFSRDSDVIAAGAEYLRAASPQFVPFSIGFVLTHIMRSTERVRLPMVTTMIALSLNAILNYLLIFGIGPFPALGVSGAAIATVISRCLETLIILIAVRWRRYEFAMAPRELFRFNAAFAARYFKIAVPVMVNEFIWSLGITIQSVILARTHTDAIAAFNIVNTVSQLTWVFFIGLGNGIGVMIGKRIGEGQGSSARLYASRIARFAPLMGAVFGLLLFGLARFLPFFFKVEASVFAIANAMFLIMAIAYPLRALNMAIVIGVCRAGGDTVYCVFIDVFFMWTVALPAAALASFIFGAPAIVVYLFLQFEEPLKAIIGLSRLRSGRWLHDVTRDDKPLA